MTGLRLSLIFPLLLTGLVDGRIGEAATGIKVHPLPLTLPLQLLKPPSLEPMATAVCAEIVLFEAAVEGHAAED